MNRKCLLVSATTFWSYYRDNSQNSPLAQISLAKLSSYQHMAGFICPLFCSESQALLHFQMVIKKINFSSQTISWLFKIPASHPALSISNLPNPCQGVKKSQVLKILSSKKSEHNLCSLLSLSTKDPDKGLRNKVSVKSFLFSFVVLGVEPRFMSICVVSLQPR